MGTDAVISGRSEVALTVNIFSLTWKLVNFWHLLLTECSIFSSCVMFQNTIA